MRRAAFIGAAFFLSSTFGVISLVSWMTRGTGPGRGSAPAVFIILFSVVAALFFVVLRRIGSPLADVVAAAHQIADGRFDVRLPIGGPPALRAVAHAFNDMAGRLARQEQQRRELMADVAHELRTPLSIAQGRLEGLIDGVYPLDAAQLEPLLDETRVLARLVEDLRTLANAESGVLTLAREPTDVGMLVRDAVAAVDGEARQRGTTVAVREAAALPAVDIDPVRIRQVVVNLLANAVRHGGDRGSVSIDVGVVDGALRIAVADPGPGLSPGELSRIFDRFYKGRASSGSGLGLTIARRLVEAHGGQIRAESQAGRGTVITVVIPLVSP